MSDPMPTIVDILAPTRAGIPLPADPDPAADTTSIPVVDLRLAGLADAMREVASRLQTAAYEASEGKSGAYEFYGDLEKDLGTWAQDILNAIDEAVA